MASISTFGYLPLSPPQSTALNGASSSTTRCRTTVAARLADQSDDFSPIRSSGWLSVIFYFPFLCGLYMNLDNLYRLNSELNYNFLCGCVVISGEFDRRQMLVSSVGLLIGALSFDARDAAASQFADMPALRGKDYGKTKMKYPDYTETQSGLQYKDLRVGTGPKPKNGEKVVVDWDGYTIGYYGRIFEARNKTKGGSFEGGDKEFFKFTLGSHEVIPAFEEAVSGMALGGIRRVIVPPELGYPENDYNKSGPRPTTFSGQRALDFVLKNQGLIDKTLLFDVELLKIVPN